MRELADGSQLFGDLIGSSRADREYVNSLSDWGVPDRNLPIKDTQSSEHLKLLPLINLLPPSWRIPILAGTTLGVAGLTAACGATQVSAEERNLINDEENVVPSQDLNLTHDIEPFLIFPVEQKPGINIQRGWFWGIDNPHGGIDFINGQINHFDTWETFEVRAAAAGLACLNPPNSEGDAVFITHSVEGEIIYTYYGHLRSWIAGMPNCGEDTIEVYQGQKIGMAGSSGMQNSDLVHLHLRLIINNQSVDPFDIYGSRVAYPDFGHSNNRFCGEDSLFFREVCARSENDIVGAEDDSNIEQGSDSDNELSPTENDNGSITGREQYVESTAIEARNLTLRFVDLLQSGNIDDIDEAYYMQITWEQHDELEGYKIRRASYEDLLNCSEQMINGGMRNVRISEGRKPRIDRDGSDIWGAGVFFSLDKWNGVAAARVGFLDYNPDDHETNMWFRYVNGELKITQNFLCKAIKSPLTVAVNYIPGQ